MFYLTPPRHISTLPFASIWRRQSYFRFSPDSRRSSEGSASHAKITAIPRGIGQGQIAVSGTLARTNSLGGATVFPAKISIPDGMSRDSLRLGMSGSATAFSEKAGVIGLLASILVWVSSYTAYL
jgi:hypothetical protein